MRSRKGFMEETVLFAVLMVTAAMFVLILAQDAPSEMESIFELLKNVAYVGVALVPVFGAYFAWKSFH